MPEWVLAFVPDCADFTDQDRKFMSCFCNVVTACAVMCLLASVLESGNLLQALHVKCVPAVDDCTQWHIIHMLGN